MRIMLLMAVLVSIAFMGCVGSNTDSAPIPPTDSSAAMEKSVPDAMQKSNDYSTPQAVVATARMNQVNAVYQVEYAPFPYIFGSEFHVVEARDNGEEFAYGELDVIGTTTKSYLSGGVFTECSEGECVVNDSPQNFFRVGAMAGNEIEIESEAFGSEVTPRTIAGRPCHEITLMATEEESALGDLTICLDDQFGFPLYLYAEPLGEPLEITAERVMNSVDYARFVPTP